MNINSESIIRHPIDAVYTTYRDELPALAEFLPDVSEIRVLSREDGVNGPSVVNEWFASADLPEVAKKFIKPEMMRWKDRAEWNDAEKYVAWTLEIPAFKGQVQCSGRNTFTDDGNGGTRVVLTGDLKVNIKKIPGVPRLLVGRIAPKIESFVVRLITPNLKNVNVSLQQYLDKK